MCPTVDQYIKQIIEKQDFTTYDIETVPINTNGGNYLGELCAINIKGKTKNGAKELNLFVKKIINKEFKIMSMNEAFLREAYFYSDLAAKYNELQESAKVPLNNRYKTATSYGNVNTDSIVLQNLTKEGFKTGHRMDCVTLEYAQEAIKQLAKFHGLSFVLKERDPKYFENKIKSLKHLILFNDAWKTFYKSAVGNSLNHFKVENKNKIEDLLLMFMEKYQYYSTDSESTVFCVSHGDYRINNIMHRVIDGSLELIPIDYQFLHYGCPILDFLYFISLSTDKEFRKKHLEDLKNLYYDSLSYFLKYFEIDVESIFPRREFDRVYQERFDFLLIGVLYYGPFIFASEEALPDLAEIEPTVKITEEGIKRMHEIYEDAVEIGYL